MPQVLSIFKKLHRTKQVVFRDDIDMLIMSRGKINEEFKLNKNIAEEEKIKELIETAKTCEHELRTAIIQVAEKSPNQYGELHFIFSSSFVAIQFLAN